MKKQQNTMKGRPRGRPFKPGESGNPAGRPRGSLNKTTLAVLDGIRRAEEELAKPLMLDMSLPYESWSDRFVQFGRVFHKDTMLEIPSGGPPPVQPKMADHRKFRSLIEFKGKDYLIQEGWLFSPMTWEAVKI